MQRKETRNAHGSGTIRKRKDGLWEARYVVGTNPGTGKAIRKSIYGKNQTEVRKALTTKLKELDDGTYMEPSKITLGQWLDIWLTEHTGDKKWSTVKHYTAQVETHIKPALGAVKLSYLVPLDIQKFYNALLKDGHAVTHKDESGKKVIEYKSLSAKSVRNIHGILTKALSVAVDMEYIKLNPADRVTLPRVEKKEIKPLMDEQVKELFEDCGRG